LKPKKKRKSRKTKRIFKKEISSGYYKRIVALPDEVVKEK
jgi:HSP20 family molecular chaperone IbpA